MSVTQKPSQAAPMPPFIGMIGFNPDQLLNSSSVVAPTASASSLFTDGLFLIYSYLTLADMSASVLSVCRNWYEVALREQSRNFNLTTMSWNLTDDIFTTTSPLRYHISSLVVGGPLVGPYRDTPIGGQQSIAEFWLTLNNLSSLTSFATRISEPSPKQQMTREVYISTSGPPSTLHLALAVENVKLRELEIDLKHMSTSYQYHFINWIAQLPQLTYLRMDELFYYSSSSYSSSSSLSSFASATRLTTLSCSTPLWTPRIGDCKSIDRQHATWCSELALIPNLTELTFSTHDEARCNFMPLMDAGIFLPRLQKWNERKQIDLRFYDRDYMMQFHRAFPSITELTQTRFREYDLMQLSLFKELKSLALFAMPVLHSYCDPPIHIERLVELLTTSTIANQLTHLLVTNDILFTSSNWNIIFTSMPHLTHLTFVNYAESYSKLTVLPPTSSMLPLVLHHRERIYELTLELSINNQECLDVLLQFTSLRRLIIHDATTINTFDGGIDYVKDRLSSSDLLPQLEYLELSPSKSLQMKSKFEQPLGMQRPFIFDRNQKYKTGTYRMNSKPTTPRLVGIELNPGPPTSSFVVAALPQVPVIFTAQDLFTDALNMIFSYFTLHDLSYSLLFTCRHWYTTAASSRNRSRNESFRMDVNRIRLFLSSSLRHHCTSLVLELSKLPLDVHLQTFNDFYTTLQQLPSLTSYATRIRQDVSKLQLDPMANVALNLKELEIELPYHRSSDAQHQQLIEYLAVLPSLTSLRCSNLFGTCSLHSLTAFPSQLTHLVLTFFQDFDPQLHDRDPMDMEGTRRIMRDLSSFPYLEYLKLGNGTFYSNMKVCIDDELVFPHLQRFDQPLECLDESHKQNNVSRQFVTKMAQSLPSLNHISLDTIRECDMNLLGTLKNLTSIEFNCMPSLDIQPHAVDIALMGEEQLASLLISQCLSLTHLHVTLNGIWFSGASWERLLNGLPQLTSLSIQGHFARSSPSSQLDLLETFFPYVDRIQSLTLRLSGVGESLDYLVQFHALRRLILRGAYALFGMTMQEAIDVLSAELMSPEVLPQLEYFEMTQQLFEPTQSKLSPPDTKMKLIYDRNQKHRTCEYRQMVVTPPAARLVGIELNPGPSMPLLQPIRSAQRLFTDGVFMIFSYLTLAEVGRTSFTCRVWYSTMTSSRGRSRSDSLLLKANQIRLFHSSSLRHHCTSLVLAISADINNNFNDKPNSPEFQSFDDFYTTLNHLPSLTSYATHIQEDLSTLIPSSSNGTKREVDPLKNVALNLRELEVELDRTDKTNRHQQLIDYLALLPSLTSLRCTNLIHTFNLRPFSASTCRITHLDLSCHIFYFPNWKDDRKEKWMKQVMHDLASMSHLLELNIQHMGRIENNFEACINNEIVFPRLQRLKNGPINLGFSFDPRDFSSQFIQQVSHCLPSLTHFELYRGRECDMKLFGSFKYLTSLEICNQPHFTDEDCSSLPEDQTASIIVEQCPLLTHLHLVHHCISFDASSWQILFHGLIHLTSLSFEGRLSPFNGRKCEPLLEPLLPFADRLHVLTLRLTEPNDEKLEHLLQLISLHRLTLYGDNMFGLTQRQMRDTLSSPFILPNLEYLEMREDVHNNRTSKLFLANLNPVSNSKLIRFIYDRNQKHQTGEYRQVKSLITPPPAQLVGIELNPRPSTSHHQQK